jgi:hypothetical protein
MLHMSSIMQAFSNDLSSIGACYPDVIIEDSYVVFGCDQLFFLM